MYPPPPRQVHPDFEFKFPYVFLGDEAFPGRENLMKPYPGSRTDPDMSKARRVYNYRLSRARRTVESTFGLFSARFRFLRHVVEISPPNYKRILLAAVVLHNFVMKDVRDTALEAHKLDEIFTRGIQKEDCAAAILRPLRRQGLHSGQKAKDIRSKFAHYFNTVGALPGQNKAAGIPDEDTE